MFYSWQRWLLNLMNFELLFNVYSLVLMFMWLRVTCVLQSYHDVVQKWAFILLVRLTRLQTNRKKRTMKNTYNDWLIDWVHILTTFGSTKVKTFFVNKQHTVFTARRSYASAVLGVVILCVRPSVCLLHTCFVTNPKNLPAIFLYHMKGQSF